MVVASADEPAPSELVVARHVVPHAPLPASKLFAIAPDDLAAADELVVDRARERTPPQRRIHAEELRGEAAEIDVLDDAGRIVAVRIRRAEIDVGRLRNVLVPAQ